MSGTENSCLIALHELRAIEQDRVAGEQRERVAAEQRRQKAAEEERRLVSLAVEERADLRRALDDAGRRIAAFERDQERAHAVTLSPAAAALEPEPAPPARRHGWLWSLPAIACALVAVAMALRPPVVRERVVVRTIPSAPLIVAAPPAPVTAPPSVAGGPKSVVTRGGRRGGKVLPALLPVREWSSEECDKDPLCHVDEKLLRR